MNAKTITKILKWNNKRLKRSKSIKKIRATLKMTQKELGKKIGMSSFKISRIESGRASKKTVDEYKQAVKQYKADVKEQKRMARIAKQEAAAERKKYERKVSDILATDYRSLSQKDPTEYIKQLEYDYKKLQNVLQKRINNVQETAAEYGIQDFVTLRHAEDLGFIYKEDGTYKVRSWDQIGGSREEMLEGIRDLKRLYRWDTLTVGGFKKKVIAERQEQLGKMFGMSKKWSRENITTDTVRNYWRAYNRFKEEHAEIESDKDKSERFITVLTEVLREADWSPEDSMEMEDFNEYLQEAFDRWHDI